MSKSIKQGEIAVSQNDFGLLVEEFVRHELNRGGGGIVPEWMDTHVRKWWPLIEKYYQQHIITAVEVAIALDNPPRYGREELRNRYMWEKIVKDLRPARSPFTVKYACSKCKTAGVKLWRDYQTCADACELECAHCLAPDEKVDDEGMWQEPPYKAKDAKGNEIPGMRTEQLKGKVPAIPVDDTYWGYSSVPSQDVEWWKALPTYRSK
jgi:hypothetical protein